MARTTTKAPATSAKMKAFEDALAFMNKSFKSDTGILVAKLSDRPQNVETISTGSVVMDSILGGGFPKGRIIEIYGPEASGKTSMALTAVGNVQKDGGTAVFIDLENALDPRYARKLGVDVDNLAVAQPDYAEQALELVEKLAASGTVDIIIVDSVAALVPKIELEGELEEQNMAVIARILSRALKKLVNTANKSGTTIIFINQVREKVGGYMGGEVTPGGKALKFFASQRLRVARRKPVVDENKNTIGNEVHIVVKKNKIAPPFLEGETVLTYNRGINRAAEMLAVGEKYGVLWKESKTARKIFEASSKELIGSGKADALKRLENDSELLERLTQALLKAIDADLNSDNSITQGDEDLNEIVETEAELDD